MIGIDLVYIPEFKKQLNLGGDSFLSESFNQKEMKDSSIDHLAGVWAAKEAVMKTNGVKPHNWTDIIISYDKNGRPMARLEARKFEISISHHGDYVVAVAQALNQ